MFTEKEAKAKWCPFVRASIYEAADNDVSGNRAGPLRESGGCIASACMAWRGQDRIVETGRKIPTSTSAAKPEGNWYWSHSVDGPVWAETAVERVGYCGLAGMMQA